MCRACRDKGNKAQGSTPSEGVSALSCNSWEAQDMSETDFSRGKSREQNDVGVGAGTWGRGGRGAGTNTAWGVYAELGL
jgi:hypothetical protein